MVALVAPDRPPPKCEARERIAELADILAAGLMRVLAPKSSGLSTDGGESSLHLSPPKSGDPSPLSRRNSDG